MRLSGHRRPIHSRVGNSHWRILNFIENDRHLYNLRFILSVRVCITFAMLTFCVAALADSLR